VPDEGQFCERHEEIHVLGSKVPVQQLVRFGGHDVKKVLERKFILSYLLSNAEALAKRTPDPKILSDLLQISGKNPNKGISNNREFARFREGFCINAVHSKNVRNERVTITGMNAAPESLLFI
jgi:hypothetical protein